MNTGQQLHAIPGGASHSICRAAAQSWSNRRETKQSQSALGTLVQWWVGARDRDIQGYYVANYRRIVNKCPFLAIGIALMANAQ